MGNKAQEVHVLLYFFGADNDSYYLTMNKVLIIVPLDIYNFKYPHVFDFINEYKSKFEVEILIIPERGYWIEKYIERIKRTFYKRRTIHEILRLVRFFFQLSRRRKNQYEYVISIDSLSYIFACYFLKNKNHVLWSLDFVAVDNESHENYYEKKIQHYTRKYLLTHRKIIIQSFVRFQLFLKSINISLQEAQIIEPKYLPVSLVDIPLLERSNLNGIKTNSVTLIQIGGINQARSHSCDLISEFQKIDGMKLILHGFISAEVTEFIFNKKPVKMPVLSNVDLPADMIAKFLANADIGFVSYVANDENFVNIDWASGQIAEHLRAGLPVICHGNTSLNNFVVEHNIGLGIKDMGELSGAITKITSEYKDYSHRCRKLFEEKMDIEKLVPVYFN